MTSPDAPARRVAAPEPPPAPRAGMSQTELVAMLRSRARKSGTQTSGYRGVSMLKQTGKWHAQINVGGKQARARAAPPATGCPTGNVTRDRLCAAAGCREEVCLVHICMVGGSVYFMQR